MTTTIIDGEPLSLKSQALLDTAISLRISCEGVHEPHRRQAFGRMIIGIIHELRRLNSHLRHVPWISMIVESARSRMAAVQALPAGVTA